MGTSEDNEAAHIMHGMVYDQLGQMLSRVVDGRLYQEDVDFKVFDFADDGIYNVEDGLTVNKTWLAEPGSEETMVRFLKVGAAGSVHGAWHRSFLLPVTAHHSTSAI